MSGLHAVVTTIQRPTPSMGTLAQRLSALGVPLIVIGDKSGPDSFDLTGAQLSSLEHQRGLGFALARLAPERHYSRKNLGYLIAMSRGASSIYETDDDNAPLPSWTPRSMVVAAAERLAPAQWRNVYEAFTDEFIWPRGFPLNWIRSTANASRSPVAGIVAPIQQGLANGSPHVDAIWRLLHDKGVSFRDGPSVTLPRGSWCPFNSQTTWWWPAAYPLMYLPSHCSFRMTDIWRSSVAQRGLWKMGCELVFHSPLGHSRAQHAQFDAGFRA